MTQKNFRFGWLIISVMMLVLVPKEMQAQQEETLGRFTVTKGEGGECSFTDNKLTVTAGTVTVSTSEETSQTIAIKGTAKLILAGVKISTNSNTPIDIITGSDAVIELAENTDNYTISNSDVFAGIHVAVGSKVTFTGSGNLEAKNTITSDNSSCGIGGQKNGENYSCGTIIFNLDGKITAEGGYRSAGIGTCKSYEKTASGSILIKEGTINATGGTYASGIGTGPDGWGGSMTICIEGGTITANRTDGQGEENDRGIGNGFNGSVNTYITITGGIINGNVGARGKELEQVIIGPDATVIGNVFGYKNAIIFDGTPKTATVKGDVTIPANITLTIDKGETLTIPEGKTLTIDEGGSLISYGTISNNGKIIDKGTFENNGTLTGTGTCRYERTGLKAGNYGTICLPYTVSENARSGAEFFSIAGKKVEDSKITWLVLEEVSGELVAGKPYIFKATTETLSCEYPSDAVAATSAGSDNGLVGCFTQATVTGGDNNYYVLKDNVIYKCGEKTWNIAANRAYIDMSLVSEYTPDAPSPAKRVVKMSVSGDATGIGSVRAVQQDGVYYNMQGQRVASPSHGVYIVNGKKVVIK